MSAKTNETGTQKTRGRKKGSLTAEHKAAMAEGRTKSLAVKHSADSVVKSNVMKSANFWKRQNFEDICAIKEAISQAENEVKADKIASLKAELAGLENS